MSAVIRDRSAANRCIGGAVGGLVALAGLAGFIGLFLANAVTYLVFVAVLLVVVRNVERPEPLPGGYRLVARDHTLVRLAVVNVAVIAVGWGAFTWLMPPYAASRLGLGAPLIGSLLLANTAAVAVAQLPIARLAEGHRRAVLMAFGAAAFAVACLLVVTAGGRLTTLSLLVAVILVGVGECLHTTVLMPLTADLAPAGLRGRYMAAMGLSWWVGLAVAPALGGAYLDRSATAVFLAAAGLAAAAGLLALTLDRRLPAGTRRVPSGPVAEVG